MNDADHPVARLARAFEQWAAEAPAGERSPYVRIDVLDSVGQQHGSIELTERQADRLAAALAHADFCTHSAQSIASMLYGGWGAATGEPPGAQIKLSDLRFDDLDLDFGEKPSSWTAPIAASDVDNCASWLDGALSLLQLARQVARLAPFQEAQQVRVRVPAGIQPFTGVGETGVVTYVHVHVPHSLGQRLTYGYDVRLNTEDGRVLHLHEDELEPVGTSS